MRSVSSRLDADHHDRRNIGIAARADHRAEMQVQIIAELQAPVRVRQGQRAFDVVRDRFACRIGDVIDGKNDDVIAHSDAAVLTPIAENFTLLPCSMPIVLSSELWMWTCSQPLLVERSCRSHSHTLSRCRRH